MPMSETDFPLPPATFEFLVFSLKTQAEMQMGLYGFGEDKNPEGPNFPAARHAIDLLSMISEKTRSNLSMEEQRLIENALTELRFRFVQVMEKAKSATPAETTAETTTENTSDAQAAG